MSAVDANGSGAEAARRRRIGRLVDMIGPAAFPIVYFTTHDFVAATWATTGGSLVAVALRWRIDRCLAPLSAVSGILAVATGLLAAAFGAKAVLQAKPTLLHCLMGFGLIVAWLLGGRPAKEILGRTIKLPDQVWATLCLRFGLFALFLAIVNEVIVRTEPVSVWALFHFPGQLLAHLTFLATQMPLILAARSRAEATESRHS